MRPLLLLLGSLAILGAGCDLSSTPEPVPGALERAWFTPGEFRGVGIRPALAGNRLFIGDDFFVAAYDTDTGAQLWQQPVTTGLANVAYDEGRVFSFGTTVHALDAATGQTLWTFAPQGDTLRNAVNDAGGGRVFLGTRRSGRVFAVSARTGQLLWSADLAQPEWRFFNTIVSTTLHEGVVYAVLSRSHLDNGFLRSTHIVALDPATGQELWRYVDGDGTRPYQAAGQVSFLGDLVYYVDNYDGFVAAFNRQTRALVWKYDLPDEWIGAKQAPVIENGRAYVATGEGAVYAFEATTGRLLWKSERRGSFDSHALCGSYAVGSFGSVRLFDKQSGKSGPVGLSVEDGGFVASAVVSDGRKIYVSAQRGVFALTCIE